MIFLVYSYFLKIFCGSIIFCGPGMYSWVEYRISLFRFSHPLWCISAVGRIASRRRQWKLRKHRTSYAVTRVQQQLPASVPQYSGAVGTTEHTVEVPSDYQEPEQREHPGPCLQAPLSSK